MTEEIVTPDDYTTKDVITSDMIGKELIGNDAEYFNKLMPDLSQRFINRPIFRSLYEIQNYVIPNNTHPTPDAKYWQVIGEQAVHAQELITLTFNFRKAEVEIKRLERKIAQEKLKEEPDELELEMLSIELEEKQFGQVNCKKIAKERMREVKNCETIIQGLIPKLKHGMGDFEPHIEEREIYRNMIKNGNQVDYKAIEEADDPVFLDYFKKPVRRILVATPHRLEKEGNVTDFSMLQPPASYSLMLEEPYGYTVPDARNLIFQKCLDDGYEWVFFVDDDTLIPRNALVQLISNNEKVVGGMYYRKYMPLESVPMMEIDGVPAIVENYTIGDKIEDILVLPSGCTLIHRSVIEAIEQPWYKSFTVKSRAALTEDTYFCGKLKAAGFKPMLDTAVQCLHVDRQKGIAYGHDNIIRNNSINTAYAEYFCMNAPQQSK